MRSWIAAGTLALILAGGFALPAEAQRYSSPRSNGYSNGSARPRYGAGYHGYSGGQGYNRGYGYGRGYAYNGGYRGYG